MLSNLLSLIFLPSWINPASFFELLRLAPPAVIHFHVTLGGLPFSIQKLSFITS